MLVVSNLTKTFPGEETPIFKNVTFTVNAGECVGLIGPNGSGKSTLLRIAAGEDRADSGSVLLASSDVRAGYLPQGSFDDDERTVGEVLQPEAEALRAAEAEVERLAVALAVGDDEGVHHYDAALERLLRLDARLNEKSTARVLAELGLDHLNPETPIRTLSGGQKTRLRLAAFLLDGPNLLLLDEPTNHLDVDALEWLEDWLIAFDGGVLVVSHDRTFLDRIADGIVALDVETESARVFAGAYTDYVETLEREREKQWTQWREQRDTVMKMQRDISKTMERAKAKERATKDDRQRRYAKKVAMRAKAKETHLRRYLESDERVEKPGLTWNVKMTFEDVGRIRGDAVRLENVSIGYAHDAPLLANLDLTVRRGERIVVLGPNGTGKTTLLKTITGHLSPLMGRVHIAGSVQPAYLAQEQDILDPAATALQIIQAEAPMPETEARAFLHYFLFAGDDPLRPVRQLSYGERARLMLARLVARGANLLVLDEPLNHLDLPSREQFEAALANFPGSVLAVVHDRTFTDRYAHTVWHIDDGVLDVEIRAV